MKFPGACSLEYQSIVDIVIKVLLGWDMNKQEGGVGIFGELKAWAIAHKEQGRKTLHGHYHFWIRFLRALKLQLFSTDLAVREQARMDFKQYVDKVMSASYNDKNNCFYILTQDMNSLTCKKESMLLFLLYPCQKEIYAELKIWKSVIATQTQLLILEEKIMPRRHV